MAKTVGFEKLTVNGSAVTPGGGLDAAFLASCSMTLQIDPVVGTPVRFHPKGTADSTTGFYFQSGDTMSFDGDIAGSSFFNTGASAQVNILYLQP